MSIAPLFNAVTLLRVALQQTGTLGPDDRVTIELPYPAAERFQAWLAVHRHPMNAVSEMRTVDGVEPHREVDFGPVRVKWPVKLIADDKGRIVPEPAATAASQGLVPRMAPAASPAPIEPGYENCTLTDGGPVTTDHRELQANGQQKGYVVLSAEERAKGFVRPVRRAYQHVGMPAPKNPLRDLTPEEHERYDKYGYVKSEDYPPSGLSAVCGKFWTQAELDKIDKGCRTVTTMGQALAETYARDPSFYGGTYCCGCGTHHPVGATGEFIWDGTDERVGT